MAVLAVNIGDIMKGAMIMDYEYQAKFVGYAEQVSSLLLFVYRDLTVGIFRGILIIQKKFYGTESERSLRNTNTLMTYLHYSKGSYSF